MGISLAHLLSNNLMSIPKICHIMPKLITFIVNIPKNNFIDNLGVSNCKDELLIIYMLYIIVSNKLTVYLYIIIYVVFHRTAIFVNNILCIFFNVLKDM